MEGTTLQCLQPVQRHQLLERAEHDGHQLAAGLDVLPERHERLALRRGHLAQLRVNWGNTSYYQTDLNGVPFLGAPFTDMRSTGNTTNSKNNNNPWPNFGKVFGLANITDGTSNTIFAGEEVQGQGQDLRGFTWWSDAAGFTTYLGPNSKSPDIIYNASYCQNRAPNPPCTGPEGAATSNPKMMAARSWHPGGVNVLLGDGSVKFIRDSISITTWRALSTTQGGEIVSADAY